MQIFRLFHVAAAFLLTFFAVEKSKLSILKKEKGEALSRYPLLPWLPNLT
jgi:hypothetical protein